MPFPIRRGDAGPVGRLLGWGLGVDWTAKPLINARAETLAEKRTFRPLLERRCLVPATAYFEWRKDGKARHKNRIRPEDAVTRATNRKLVARELGVAIEQEAAGVAANVT